MADFAICYLSSTDAISIPTTSKHGRADIQRRTRAHDAPIGLRARAAEQRPSHTTPVSLLLFLQAHETALALERLGQLTPLADARAAEAEAVRILYYYTRQ